MKKLLVLCAVLAAFAVFVAGCGSSGSSSSSTTSTEETGSSTEGASSEESASGGAAAAEKAEANLAKLTNEPPEIDIPPMKEPPKPGVEITIATCPIPVCVSVQKGAEEASDALGWHAKIVNQGLTPATVQSAWNAIAQDPGEGVIADGVLPNSQVEKQLESIAADNVPYVGVAQSDPPGPLMLAALTSPAKVAQDGERLANWVVADSGGEPGETIFVYDPNITVLAEAPAAFKKTIEELAPETKTTELKVAAADIGTKIPAQVVNELRTHPDAKYVAFQLGDLATGVSAAIKAAHLPSEPKLVARVVSAANEEEIKAGGMAAALTEESVEAGWRAVDLIARAINGEKIYSTTPLPQAMFVTAENVPSDTSETYEIPGFQKQFEEAWGK